KARFCTRTASRSGPRARGARGWATTRRRSTSPPCGSPTPTTATPRSSWGSRRCASATAAARAGSRRPRGACTCWSTPGWRASGASGRSGRSWGSRSASTTRARTSARRCACCLVSSLSQHYSGQIMRVAAFAMAGLADRPPRYLVIVDDDIDPTNAPLGNWAIAPRVDPAAQIHIQRDRWCNVINPAGLTPAKRAIEDYTLGTVVIDTCKPFRWRHDWDRMFSRSDIGEGWHRQAVQRWEGVLGELITA